MTYTEPRVFQLVRHEDVTGFSGTGTVAEGIQFSDGSVALRWLSEWPATCAFEAGIQAVIAVHGHNGATEVRWVGVAHGDRRQPDRPDDGSRLGTAWEHHDDILYPPNPPSDPHWPPPAP